MCYYVKTFNCCMFIDLMPPCQSSIFFIVFHFFILYIFPHHISVVISYSIVVVFSLIVHTSFQTYVHVVIE